MELPPSAFSFSTTNVFAPVRVLLAGGTIVSLASNSGFLTVPATVLVPAGASSVNFLLSTSAVATDSPAIVTATLGTISSSSTITVRAPVLTYLGLSTASTTGGSTVQGTVYLNVPAPTGGMTVSLSDDSTNTSMPATVLIPAGAKSASFTVSTSVVTISLIVHFKATLGNVVETSVLTINP